ncbi:MAG TPA: PQQ-binding-like beta-propeller repeat protein [Verrucomicrobiae bacterium]
MTASSPANAPAAPSHVRWLDFARSGAVVAGLFSAVVGLVLLVNHFLVPTDDPVKSVELAQAKEKLHATPTDEALKQRIRDLDLQARRTYFRHLQINLLGAWLLIAGSAVFVLAARRVRVAVEGPHLPKPSIDAEAQQARARRIGRWAIAGSGATLMALLLVLGATGKSPLPATQADLKKLLAGGAAAARPDVANFLAGRMTNWHQFRGPLGIGIATTTNAPLTWNVTNGEGVVWKSPVPAHGHSSPVVWGNRVFLTGGDAKAREVMCFDAAIGSLVWQRPVPPPPAGFAKELEVPEETGFAACTPATDGTRVFASFASGEVVAFDFAGNVVWTKYLGVPENMYGHSTSLLLWQDRLIVQFDQADAEAGKSRLYAFDTATGRELWQQRRPVGASWATPIVVEQTNRTQIIALGEPWLMGYAAASGTELWRADCLGSDVAPSPLIAAGMVIIAAPHKHLAAVRLDGQGDVTQTHIAWIFEDYVPDITSPVANDELLFSVTTSGLFGCVDVKTGKKVWDADLNAEFNASPTLVGDRLYLISLKGNSIVLAAAREQKELARGHLGEPVHASPAFVGERVFVRGTKSLFCLGEKK